MRHPIQPIVRDKHGVARFKANKIVQILLDDGPFDMNDIAEWTVSREDREEFAQLIGYSVSGFGDLSYASDDVVDAADAMVECPISEETARIHTLQSKLDALRDGLRPVVAELFGKHPDDLT